MSLKTSLKDLALEVRGRTGQALRRFAGWWRAELERAWDDWAQRHAPRAGVPARIVFADGAMLLEQVLPSGFKSLAGVPLPATASAMAEALEQVLRGQAPVRKLDIVLPVEAVLRRRVRMPAAVERRLQEAVGFQLERLMPLKAGQAYHGCYVAARDEARRTLLVEIAETRRELVEALAGSALGSGVRRVSVMAGGGAGPPIRFLDKAGAAAAGSYSVERRLAYAMAGLVLAVVVVALGQYHLENRRLESQVQALKTRAAAAEALRDGLQTRVGRIEFLAGRTAGADAATVLAELTRLLPDDSWVFQFQEEGGQLQLAGFSRDASALSAQLRKSALFRDVSLRSAVKAPGIAGERFDIVIHLNAPVRS